MISGKRGLERHLVRGPAAGVSLAAAGICASVLAGWLLGVPWLRGLLPGWAPMNFNTAVCLLLYAVALWLLPGRAEAGMSRQRLAGVVALVCMAEVIATATLGAFALGRDWRVDRWLFRPDASLPPERMSVIIALHLLVLGMAILFLLSSAIRGKAFARVLAGGVAAIPAIALFLAAVAYASPDAWRTARPQPFAAILGLCLVCAGVFFARRAEILAGHSRVGWKLALGFGLAALIIAFVGLVSLLSIQELLRSATWIRHTYDVIESTNALESALAKAENARRGHALTGNDRFISRFDGAVRETESLQKKLAALTADNPAQAERLARIGPLLQKRVGLLSALIELQKKGRLTPQQHEEVVNQGVALSDSINDLLHQARSAEQEVLTSRKTAADRAGQQTLAFILLAVSLTFLALIPAGWSIWREFTARQRVEAELRTQRNLLNSTLESMCDGLVAADANGRFTVFNAAAERILGVGAVNTGKEGWSAAYHCYLPDGAREFPSEQLPLALALRGESVQDVEILIRPPAGGPERTISVSGRPLPGEKGAVAGGVVVFRDITEARAARLEIERLNAALARRNAELLAANKELEAFTYSTSHDLRAPLRHVDGFSKILLDDFAGHLNADGIGYLHRIRSATKRMGQLIDDLLQLSRVGRSPLAMKPANPNAMVAEARRALQPELRGRDVEWKVAQLPIIECDPSLMRQVFINLLSNAAKYSRPRKPAVIEVGTCRHGENTAIFVRDNGVGFDMKYANKLFGVFQRLHRQDEFEGTGVGLATVMRIVHKHRCEAWAESQPDRGATFYFTVRLAAAGGFELDGDPALAAPAGGMAQEEVR